MQVTISGKNFDVSDALREYVMDKLTDKKFSGRFDTIVTANVTLSTDKSRHIAEITLFGKGFEMRAEERDSYDMYRSISVVVERLEKQLARARERTLDRSRQVRGDEKPAEPEEEGHVVSHEASGVIIEKVVSYLAEPMSVEEAIKAMSDKNYTFYAFHNSETGRVNVVYATERGFSLIDPRI